VNKHIKIPQFWRGIKKFFTDSPNGTSSELVITQKALSNFKSGFSSGQTWCHRRTLTTRVFNVRYTNTNNFPIQVHISFRSLTQTGEAAKFYVDDENFSIGIYYPGNRGYIIDVIIPPGSEYWLMANSSLYRLYTWSELR
ncbi:hypothetical protein, partial [Vibrio sp. 10N.222.48.A4]|uniref:hypothetical protein n=1 Tax=Vibrio sp. 10N.222.48.A4 TaxID=3229605 RepID=UPI0035533335